MSASDFANTVAGVNGNPGWLVVFVGSGLLIGTFIGGIHRLLGSAKNAESIDATYRCYEV